MNLSEKVALRLLSNLDPEKAHNLAIRALKFGFIPKTQGFHAKSLELSVAGLKFKNPLGLAAGFDKNAEAIKPLLEFGFGFIEVGAVTPLAQIGNPKPRLFRLKEDSAIINRFGFNNDGMHEVSKRLSKRPSNGIVGLNLGANKNSADRISDFATVFKTCSEFIDFATVNVSSPNTENLRKLQSDKELRKLLNEVSAGQDGLKTKVPVFLKIAPDLEKEELKNIALVATDTRIDGIIATNTTISRNNLKSSYQHEKGGLSGAPIFEMSTRVLAQLYSITEGKIPLIGVGGVFTGEQLFQKIQAGASLVQIYSALIYSGFSVTNKILRELDISLRENGFKNVEDAVGTGVGKWL
tara:strand:+ start:1909 stop:2967 length:1059 start_codon:yes stop_codon:yes gene_type:complete